MKRLVDVLIGLLFLAVLGVGGYFVYTEYLADELNGDTTDDTTAESQTAANGVVQLPLLRMEQLTAILPSVSDLPANLRAATVDETITVDLNADQRIASLTENQAASNRFAELRSAYSWTSGASVRFNTVTLNQSTSFVRALVSQFPTTQQARDFIDDPLVRGYYTGQGYDLQLASDLHGWLLTSRTPVDGTGYAAEYQTLLFFDHLGLLVVLQANTDAAADPALGQQIVTTVAPGIVDNIRALDALQTVTIPPTPTSQPITASLLTADIQTADLQGLIPGPRTWDLNALYNLSDQDSTQYTLTELIAFYESIGTPALDQLAAAIDRAGRRYGLIAQAIRVWRPETQCPVDAPVRVEMDLSLFERPAGADTYMRDPALQEAWRGTGVFSEFQDTGDGVFAFGSAPDHACGPMQVVQKSTTYERLLFTLSLTVPASTDRQVVMDQIDNALASTLDELYLEHLQ